MIGIIGAMQLEVDEILAISDNYTEKTIHGIKFYDAFIKGVEVVVLLSGIGKTNAAVSTTLLLDNYDLKLVLNIGTAGGLQSFEKVLDVIVSTKVAHYDVDVPGWKKGFNYDSKDSSISTPTLFEASSKYVKIISDCIGENSRVFTGPIASGDQFIYRADQYKKILKDFPEALCAEMEGAAIAQVCNIFNVDFVIIRSLSDITIAPSNELTFEEYAVKASKRSAKWVYELVDKLH
jgi:adenosylhomocysteine nucleosidase